MPAIVTDPANLTKEKLKIELKKFNIPLPSSDARKDEYIELYRSKILNADRLEFSSDDEAVSLTPKRNKKKPGATKKAKPISKVAAAEDEVDVSTLTDAQLLDKLKELGGSFGPITATTRKVYERKLQKLLEESIQSEGAVILNDEEINENEFSDTDETEVKTVYNNGTESYSSPVVKRMVGRTVPDSPLVRDSPVSKRTTSLRSSPRKPVKVVQEIEQQDEVDNEIVAPIRSNRDEVDNEIIAPVRTHDYYTKQITRRSIRSATETLQKQFREESQSKEVKNSVAKKEEAKSVVVEKKSSRFSIWIQLAIILVVALVIFLVIQNMEPAHKVGKINTEV